MWKKWRTATIGVYSVKDKGDKPSEKYDNGWRRFYLKVKIFLYNKGLISKLDYENESGGTTYRRRTQSVAKNIRQKLG